MADSLIFIAGILVLLVSGEFLVRGGVQLARRFRVSSLVIGVTVVSLGTSAPELVVSLEAALTGHPSIAVGNVIGSNISNLALILGLVALFLPIPVNRDTLRIDWPIMMLASILFFIFIQDFSLERWQGYLFFILLISYVLWSILRSRNEQMQNGNKLPKPSMALWIAIVLVIASSVGLVIGARLLVEGASGIALDLGVSERVISVSIVALGTSIPELATSLVAAIRKEMDISVGNIIGSNIFNIFGILGLTAIIVPIPVEEKLVRFDTLYMLGVSVLFLLLIVFIKRLKLTRIEGLMLITVYSAYIYLVFFK